MDKTNKRLAIVLGIASVFLVLVCIGLVVAISHRPATTPTPNTVTTPLEASEQTDQGEETPRGTTTGASTTTTRGTTTVPTPPSTTPTTTTTTGTTTAQGGSTPTTTDASQPIENRGGRSNGGDSESNNGGGGSNNGGNEEGTSSGTVNENDSGETDEATTSGAATSEAEATEEASCPGFISGIIEAIIGVCPSQTTENDAGFFERLWEWLGSIFTPNSPPEEDEANDRATSDLDLTDCNLYTFHQCPVEQSLYWDDACPFLVHPLTDSCIDWEGPYRRAVCDPRTDEDCYAINHPFYSEACADIINIFTGECIVHNETVDASENEEETEEEIEEDADDACPDGMIFNAMLGNCMEDPTPGTELSEPIVPGRYYTAGGLIGFFVQPGQGRAIRSGSDTVFLDSSGAVPMRLNRRTGLTVNEAIAADSVGLMAFPCGGRSIDGISAECTTIVSNSGSATLNYYIALGGSVIRIQVYVINGSFEQDTVLDSIDFYPSDAFLDSATAV